jgi:hypothetical protein
LPKVVDAPCQALQFADDRGSLHNQEIDFIQTRQRDRSYDAFSLDRQISEGEGTNGFQSADAGKMNPQLQGRLENAR